MAPGVVDAWPKVAYMGSGLGHGNLSGYQGKPFALPDSDLHNASFCPHCFKLKCSYTLAG
jgi:hypothetical protein